MITTPIGRTFKYTFLQHPDDVTQMPLIRNLFGLNNRIYANLGSYTLEKGTEDWEKYSKRFSAEELRFGLLNNLYEIDVWTRTQGDKYETVKPMDFKELFEFVRDNHKKYYTIYAGYNDSPKYDKKGNQISGPPVLYVPLGSKILHQACNYAYQEIEKLKMDNMMMSFNPEPLQAFTKIFV